MVPRQIIFPAPPKPKASWRLKQLVARARWKILWPLILILALAFIDFPSEAYEHADVVTTRGTEIELLPSWPDTVDSWSGSWRIDIDLYRGASRQYQSGVIESGRPSTNPEQRVFTIWGAAFEADTVRTCPLRILHTGTIRLSNGFYDPGDEHLREFDPVSLKIGADTIPFPSIEFHDGVAQLTVVLRPRIGLERLHGNLGRIFDIVH